MSENKVQALVEGHELTVREAEVVLARIGDSGDVDAAVAQIKSERVGPAAVTDDTPAHNVPGGDIPNPSPNAPMTAGDRRAQLLEERARIDAELSLLEDRAASPSAAATPIDTDALDDVQLDTNEIDANKDGEITDDELRTLTVDELVEWVEQYPDDRTRVIALERGKGDQARKTLFERLGEDLEDGH